MSPESNKYSTRVDSSLNKSNLSVGRPKTGVNKNKEKLKEKTYITDSLSFVDPMQNTNLYKNNVSQIKNSLDIFISESRNIKKVISFSKEKTPKAQNMSDSMTRTPSTTKHMKKSSESLMNMSSSDTNKNNLSSYTDNGKEYSITIF